MMSMLKAALAALAGTTGLNAFTCADMAVRGRPASSAQEQAVTAYGAITWASLT